MYSLEGIDKFPALQRVVSSELARGLLKILINFDYEGPVYEIGQLSIDYDSIQHLFNHCSKNPVLQSISGNLLKEIANKMCKMYEELIDTKYEYVFDELGMYIFYLLSISNKRFLKFSDERFYYTPQGLNIFDELALRSYFNSCYDDLIEQEDEEDDIYLPGREYFIWEKIIQHSVLSYMFDESLDTFAFSNYLISDQDYMLYDQAAGPNIMISDTDNYYGFVTNAEDREPVSGSIKIPIGKRYE